MIREKLYKYLTFEKLYASELKLNKKQNILFKFSETEIEWYKGTEYYALKCIDAELEISNGKIKGTKLLLLPVPTFNRMLNREGKIEYLYDNYDVEISMVFSKKNKRHYKLYNINIL